MKAKHILFPLLLIPIMSIGQISDPLFENAYIDNIPTLNLAAANKLMLNATKEAESLGKTVTIVILDASGEIILAARGKNIGLHNTEAARRKAFTALSTKTGTLKLMRAAQANPDAQNLNTLPELLLLSGGVPIFWKDNIVGSIGIAGGGSAENDNSIAKSAKISEMGITIKSVNN